MSVVRRRYYTWLARAYIKRWYKVIFSSIIIGAGIFFLAAFVLNFYLLPILEKRVQKIGYLGTFRTEEIPKAILNDASYGLTKLEKDGSIAPAAAYKWDVKNEGKEYVFYIQKGQHFHNGRELTAETLNFNFKDVEKKIIDEYTVSLSLKDPYAPFLASVAIPLFDEDLAGLGEYEVKKVDLNAGFVKSIVLQSTKNNGVKKIINFYPTENALKTAYSLGDVDKIMGVSKAEIADSNFSTWRNTNVQKNVNYNRLVTLFYNNQDDILGNKKIRQALNYAIPETFEEGERTYSSISPSSIFFTTPPNYGISDIDIARELLADEDETLKKSITISTPADYENVARKIADAWGKLGVKTEIKVVSGIDPVFQVLLYPINLPGDPDQYTLWHSSQANNISKYKNLRIDKLLEDGRSTPNIEERLSIYADFQKYLIDDVPASFLYFPYEFEIVRK